MSKCCLRASPAEKWSFESLELESDDFSSQLEPA